MNEKPTICVNCGSVAKVVLEAGTLVEIICLECGESQNYEEFFESLKGQVHNVAVKHLAKAFLGGRGKNQGVVFKPGHIRQVRAKFRIDLD